MAEAEFVSGPVPIISSKYKLPETCTIVELSEEREVFVVGTAHFSKESQEDVAKVIREVKPQVVFLELCDNRSVLLTLDESKLAETSGLDLKNIRFNIRQHGALQGIMHLVLLNMSATLTKKLGMAPGGEFRRAFNEAIALREQGHQVTVVCGDRQINITLRRAYGSLSLWDKMRFIHNIVTSDVDISEEDIEQYKKKDVYEKMLEELGKEFPVISKVFVDERDMYLSHMLYHSTINSSHTGSPRTPVKAVAVVGLGHVKGMLQYWGQDLHEKVEESLIIPQPSRTERAVKFTIKASLLAGTTFLMYKASKKAFGFVRSFM